MGAKRFKVALLYICFLGTYLQALDVPSGLARDVSNAVSALGQGASAAEQQVHPMCFWATIDNPLSENISQTVHETSLGT
jgi:hypothetical protein